MNASTLTVSVRVTIRVRVRDRTRIKVQFRVIVMANNRLSFMWCVDCGTKAKDTTKP